MDNTSGKHILQKNTCTIPFSSGRKAVSHVVFRAKLSEVIGDTTIPSLEKGAGKILKQYGVPFIVLWFVFFFVFGAWAVTFPFEAARPLYAGARPLGMGNAFTALADDAEAGFWNPAGLVQWQGVKIAGTRKVSDREDYAFDPKCIAYSYRDTGFFWGNKIALRVDSGTPDFTYYSLAHKLTPYLAMGGSVKFKRRHPTKYYQFFGHSPGYDLGILWKPGALNSYGILIQNMGGTKRWISVVTFGFAHKFSDRSVLSVDIDTLFQDDFELEPHIGWEWQTTNWMALRIGASDGHATAGAGLKVFMFKMDYAWIRNEAGDAHFLSGQVEL